MSGLGSLPLLQALTEKMRWHQSRQQVLAENIANADTPGYVERDLNPMTFDNRVMSAARVSVATTSPMHITLPNSDGFGSANSGYEMTPSGNSVSLEDEMMKVAGNDMDYQTVTALYTRSVAILRTALGRSA